ncbi:MAG: hypothetical protein ACFB10_14255 [Salibacteraceae bacterium]
MPPINFTVPEPCGKTWNDLEPRKLGRHCNACEKVVYDMTGMTGEQILKFYRQKEGKVCGRFHPFQLTDAPLRPASWLRRFLLCLLLVFGNYLFVFADSHTASWIEKTTTEWLDAPVKVQIEVVDAVSGLTIAGAHVLVKPGETPYRMRASLTDSLGKTTLTYQQAEEQEIAWGEVEVSFPGYQLSQIAVPQKSGLFQVALKRKTHSVDFACRTFGTTVTFMPHSDEAFIYGDLWASGPIFRDPDHFLFYPPVNSFKNLEALENRIVSDPEPEKSVLESTQVPMPAKPPLPEPPPITPLLPEPSQLRIGRGE